MVTKKMSVKKASPVKKTTPVRRSSGERELELRAKALELAMKMPRKYQPERHGQQQHTLYQQIMCGSPEIDTLRPVTEYLDAARQILAFLREG